MSQKERKKKRNEQRKNVEARPRAKIQKRAEQNGCRMRVKRNAAETEPKSVR